MIGVAGLLESRQTALRGNPREANLAGEVLTTGHYANCPKRKLETPILYSYLTYWLTQSLEYSVNHVENEIWNGENYLEPCSKGPPRNVTHTRDWGGREGPRYFSRFEFLQFNFYALRISQVEPWNLWLRLLQKRWDNAEGINPLLPGSSSLPLLRGWRETPGATVPRGIPQTTVFSNHVKPDKYRYLGIMYHHVRD